MLAIANTTTTANYADAGSAQFPSDSRGALTPYVQGFLFVANNPAYVSVLRGKTPGGSNWTPDTLVQPTMVPITTDRGVANPDYIWGVRARDAVAGTHAQVFGALFQAGEAAFTPGAQFSGTVAASGGFTPAQQTVITYTTTFPATPTDGDIIAWAVDGVNFPGADWLLRYNATRVFWEFLGGSPLLQADAAGAFRQNSVDSVWENCPGVSAVTLARAGTYRVQAGFAQSLVTNAGDTMLAGISVAAAAPATAILKRLARTAFAGAQDFETLAALDARVTVTAGQTVALQIQSAPHANVAFLDPWLAITPIQIV